VNGAVGALQAILVLGGSSEIGTAIARRLAPARQATVILPRPVFRRLPI
jgi:NAD(P)-dependent dehydrogenase (short-subunit alcohol dehydrogenase family)